MNRLLRIFFWVLIVGIVVFGLLNISVPSRIGGSKSQTVAISELSKAISEGKVEQVTVDGHKLEAKEKDGTILKSVKEDGAKLADYGITADKVKIEIKDGGRNELLLAFVSAILPVLLIGGFIYLLMRSAQGNNMRAMNFGRSKARLYEGAKRVKFSDVAGLTEAKQELLEIVDFLKSPEKFRKIGAEIPKGVLLVGPPGVGKTLLAKAVAGEAGVPFFSISASEFVEMFVGVGASRVRDLFQKAKHNSPCIIFVDELDAIGRQRGAGLGGSHDEREQTLNQILVEMDGFETDTNVIVMAATNRPDILDAALLRPGRFDRRVMLDLPTKEEREAILAIHSRSKAFEEKYSLNEIAAQTAGFSGADLKNLVNEAAILAVRKGKKKISQLELGESIEKVMLGPERRGRLLSDDEKRVTAVHESGHAIVSHVLPGTDPVHKISIISRGMALGHTWSIPTTERYLQPQSRFQDEIAALLGGRMAEMLVFGEGTTGAANDLKRATLLARKMVTEFGMSERLGQRTYGAHDEMIFLGREISEQRDYSEKIAAIIDDEVARIIKRAEESARKILVAHRSILNRLSEALLVKETIDSVEFGSFFKKIDTKRDRQVKIGKAKGKLGLEESTTDGLLPPETMPVEA